MIKYLTSDFDKELGNNKVLVDFYADWCGPCRMMGEILETVDGIDILKVNIDKFPLVAEKYGVMSIPTLMLFNDGKVIRNSVGVINKEKLNDFIK